MRWQADCWRRSRLPALLGAQAPAVFLRRQPPGPPPNRELTPYANYSRRHAAVLQIHQALLRELHEDAGVQRRGARRADRASRRMSTRCASAFWGPSRITRTWRWALAMLHGAQLAIDEANARGGYGGKPFRLMVHNDAAIWGASSNEIVKMVYDEKVWAMLGSISGDSTHIALARLAAGRSADRQQRRHRPHHSGNHHSLDPDHAFRTTACRATRWRAASTPISA